MTCMALWLTFYIIIQKYPKKETHSQSKPNQYRIQSLYIDFRITVCRKMIHLWNATTNKALLSVICRRCLLHIHHSTIYALHIFVVHRNWTMQSIKMFSAARYEYISAETRASKKCVCVCVFFLATIRIGSMVFRQQQQQKKNKLCW